jgi:hypothetical protein
VELDVKARSGRMSKSTPLRVLYIQLFAFDLCSTSLGFGATNLNRIFLLVTLSRLSFEVFCLEIITIPCLLAANITSQLHMISAMKLLTTLLSLLALTLAQFDDWHPPNTDDLRGPCPGLNALANHGFLPRDGKNLTLPTTVKGLAAINVTTETATLLTLAALKTSSDPASGAFTLADLGKHGFIEHDGSLSREDTALPGGEKLTLNEAAYNDFLGYFEGETAVSVALAAKARW